jgi:hypothetical protein
MAVAAVVDGDQVSDAAGFCRRSRPLALQKAANSASIGSVHMCVHVLDLAEWFVRTAAVSSYYFPQDQGAVSFFLYHCVLVPLVCTELFLQRAVPCGQVEG